MASATGWVCPRCDQPAQARPPEEWSPAAGPHPNWSHMDGQPLCPVQGAYGYLPAMPELSPS
jgi:hypothetical protein